ncbi:hypothetical protein ACFLU6_16470, partial [Acidobacteriota bacterium]
MATKGKKSKVEPDTGIFDRSLDFIKDVSVKIKTEAQKTLKTTNLNIEVGLKKRNLKKKLSELGEITYGLIKAKKIKSEALKPVFDDAVKIENEISAAEELIKQVLRTDEGLRKKVEEEAEKAERAAAKA